MKVEDLLPAFVAGELSADDAARVSAALATSPSLRWELARYQHLSRLLDVAATEVPAPPDDLLVRLGASRQPQPKSVQQMPQWAVWMKEDMQDDVTAEPEIIARWLLTSAAAVDQRPETLGSGMEDVQARLREHLGVVLGVTSFDTLWGRALALAQRRPAGALPDEVGEAAAVPHPPVTTAHGRDASAGRDSVVAAVTCFIDLLFTFIGKELGVHLLQER